MMQIMPRRWRPVTVGVCAGALLAQVALADPQDDRIQKEIRDKESQRKTQTDREENAKRERNAAGSPQSSGGFPRPPPIVNTPADPYLSPYLKYPAVPYDRGIRYRNGDGVAKDPVEAMRCFRLVTDDHDHYLETHNWDHTIANANYQIGLMYELGEGVDRDSLEATKWFAKAAELGNVYAAEKLGDIYSHERAPLNPVSHEDELGRVRIDLAESLKWYRKAAELNSPYAQYKLGLFYYNGQGVAKDLAEAAKWFGLAAGSGSKEAEQYLARMNNEGEVKTPETIAKIRLLYITDAERGNADTKFAVGVRFSKGDGVPMDLLEATRWFWKAAELGQRKAIFELYSILDKSRHDSAKDDYNTGFKYYWGSNTVVQNRPEAVKWFRKAADMGYGNAQVHLGYMYQKGEGVANDPAEAIKLFRMAAMQGHPGAVHSLAEAYLSRDGIQIDPIEAWAWCRILSFSGDYRSAELLRKAGQSLGPEGVLLAERRSAEIAKEILSNMRR